MMISQILTIITFFKKKFQSPKEETGGGGETQTYEQGNLLYITSIF